MDPKRSLILSLILALSWPTFSQDASLNTEQIFNRIPQVQSFSNGPVLKNAEEGLHYYNEHSAADLREDREWRMLHQNQSLKANHFTYQQYYLGIEVLDGILKINTLLNGQTYLITDYSITQSASQQAMQRAQSLSEWDKTQHVWVPNTSGELSLVKRIKANEQIAYDELFNEQNESVLQIPQDRQFHATDTTIFVQVFYPDPITSTRSQYGGLLRDFSDESNRLLNDERYLKTIEAEYDSGTFRLENDYVKIIDQSAPNNQAYRSASDSFFFDRSNPHFEEVNIYYHITRYRKHLDSLGYSSLCSYPIHCDAHAQEEDNSFYANRFNPPHLFFGDGGVDDAEDATTTIHEYGHALSDCASPNSIVGSTRQAIDEGIGDYLAASYKREINDYHWERVFPWDGHNEFWGGRWSGNNMIYPQSDVGTKHIRGQMVTGIFMNLWDDMGRNNADKLMLEVMHDLFNGMSFPDFADRIVAAEQRLFQGNYETEVCIVLSMHGLRDGCFLSAEEAGSVSEREFQFLNSDGFAQGVSEMVILPPYKGEFNVTIFDLRGNLLFQHSGMESELVLSPENFPAGSYLIQVEQNGRLEHFKSLRF
ncbi:hypothetical protein KFE98_21695 [bacterium SCSIO 12741]|nr:hypothetical protein KFE98_21695 [bacterium SCSIO 12741]